MMLSFTLFEHLANCNSQYEHNLAESLFPIKGEPYVELMCPILEVVFV